MIVKVCGMRLASNIREAETSGADWMGFIFYERSPRFVGTLPEYLPQHLQRVGVFVNSDYSYIINKVYQFRLDYVQLHGQESPELCRSLHQAGAGVIKAFALREPDDLKQTGLYAPYCDWFLFDTPSDAYGGSGKRFDWKLLDSYEGPLPFLLSGGLSPESIESLSRFRNPWWQGIDLNSGFELHPGEKDIPRLKTFINLFKTLDL